MTHKYNAQKTQEYFDNLAGDYFTAYAPRDQIFFDLILPKYKEQNKSDVTALDFGCGGGALLLKMLENGIKAQGIEKHDKLCELAKERLAAAGFSESCVIQGSIKELDNLPKNSYDFIILMGVFQYLPPADRSQLYEKIYNLLKPGGHMVATFQNAFFDLFTFNKYTVDFFQNKFFGPLGLDKLLGEGIIKDLKSLMVNPGKPDYLAATARDNIYVETTNPLTIGDELKEYNFILLQKYFYSFFFLPRLIEGQYKKKLEVFKKQFEVVRSTEWYGYFMANAFVADCIKENK